MEQVQNWRQWLAQRVKNPEDGRKIAQELEVSPITLTRWIAGTSTPRLQVVYKLLIVFADEQEKLRDLLMREFPQLQTTSSSPQEDGPSEIPSYFYAQVLHTMVTVPPILRFWSLGATILQEMISHLDPRKQGLMIILALCQPSTDYTIRSLRVLLARGTGVWSQVEGYTQLLGIESQMGYAIEIGHRIYSENLYHRSNWLSAHQASNGCNSLMVVPLRQANSIAGSLGVFSTQKLDFPPVRQNLIEHYANLLASTIPEQDYYPLNQIQLGLMPVFALQIPYLSSLQRRIQQHLLQAQETGVYVSYQQAEQHVWQELETEFLDLSRETQTKLSIAQGGSI
jgi:hypothetical protein